MGTWEGAAGAAREAAPGVDFTTSGGGAGRQGLFPHCCFGLAPGWRRVEADADEVVEIGTEEVGVEGRTDDAGAFERAARPGTVEEDLLPVLRHEACGFRLVPEGGEVLRHAGED